MDFAYNTGCHWAGIVVSKLMACAIRLCGFFKGLDEFHEHGETVLRLFALVITRVAWWKINPVMHRF